MKVDVLVKEFKQLSLTKTDFLSEVNAHLIAVHDSTKNASKKRDPKMSQTKKGRNHPFGMKA